MKDIVERLRFCEDVLSDLVKQYESSRDMVSGLKDRVRKAQAEMYNISEEITAISEGFDLQFDSGDKSEVDKLVEDTCMNKVPITKYDSVFEGPYGITPPVKYNAHLNEMSDQTTEPQDNTNHKVIPYP